MVKIWYQLVDSDGNPYKNTQTVIISLKAKAYVCDLYEAVYSKNISILTGIVSAQLKVYKNRASKDSPLKPDDIIKGLGKSVEDALIVVVPNIVQGKFWILI